MSVNGTQGAILDAASRLFASKGYDAVSMRDVAAEVGVTPANLYHHFKDKEHLVREALTHVFAEKISPMESVLREPKSPEEKFEAFVAWLVHLLMDDEVFSRLLIRELLDGDGDHLEYLAKTVLKRPFALVTNVTTEYGTRAHPVLSSVSVVGVILGHVLLSRVLPHLPGGRAEYADPTVITRHVLGVLRHAFKDESNGKSA